MKYVEETLNLNDCVLIFPLSMMSTLNPDKVEEILIIIAQAVYLKLELQNFKKKVTQGEREKFRLTMKSYFDRALTLYLVFKQQIS